MPKINLGFFARTPKRELRPTGPAAKGPDTKQAGSQPPAKKELPPLDPAELKRIKSRTVILPSQMRERTEVKPIRHPITRPAPDAVPPKDFAPPPIEPKPRKLFGIPIPFQTKKQKLAEEQRINEGGQKKWMHLNERSAESRGYFQNQLTPDSEYMEILKSRHPGYDSYSDKLKDKAFEPLIGHPKLRADMAEARNKVSAIPNGATASRMMTKDEQKFLTNAFRQLNEEMKSKPYHMHGETAITGTKKGKITQFNYNPAGESSANLIKGDKFHLHTHPPFMEPFTSSASGADHMEAARMYRHENRMSAFVTNGKDVLHIQPNSLELVKLIPDPKAEKKLGKFPVAFQLPEPQQPPRSFSSHEAPGALKPGRLIPKRKPGEGQPKPSTSAIQNPEIPPIPGSGTTSA